MTAVECLIDKLTESKNEDGIYCTKFLYNFEIEKAKQIEKQNKIDFLVWLKENHWHVYKDGKWFTSKDHAYIDGKPRKFYTEEQLIEKYKEDGKESNND